MDQQTGHQDNRQGEPPPAMPERQQPGEGFRAGYVAIIGSPNAGKSTLLNTLLGQKISIVTPKPQTTRHKILGILSGSGYQIVFLDTPGILAPAYLLQEKMMKAARSAIGDADLILLMVDATQWRPEGLRETLAFASLHDITKPVVLAINKIDLLRKEDLLPIIASCAGQYAFKEIFPISALNGFATAELVEALVREQPVHPPYYPLDIVSEQSERFFVGEIVREKIFEKFREEIPYSATVDIIDFEEVKGKKDLIHAEIYVERESQKGILIGKQGNALKEIGERARKDIEVFLGRPVYLELFVKVREKWREKEAMLNRLGYGG